MIRNSFIHQGISSIVVLEMEEVCRELDDLRSEMKTLKEDYQEKLELYGSLRQAHEVQFFRFQEAKLQIEKQSKEIDEKIEELSLSKELYEDLQSRFTEKEAALKHSNLVNENLKTSIKMKLMDLEARNSELALALDEAKTKMEEQERMIFSYRTEIDGLKGLAISSQKKGDDAKLRTQAPKEARRVEEMLAKLEEEIFDVENKLKWKTEQFSHLEEAHEKLQTEFRVSKKGWESERSTFVNGIQTLQANLDSQAVVIDELHSKLKMCNQALAHEESRRKFLEIQISESKSRYDNMLSDYEEARSTIESLTAKQDEEIASLRISLTSKTAVIKEMEFRRTQLEHENQELQASVREYQDSQINEIDTTSLKVLKKKFKALEHAHKGCSEKLKDRETEWRTQVVKLEKDLDGCFTQLIFKDKELLNLVSELEACQTSLMLQKLDNEEISTVLMIVESKFFESCSAIEHLKLEMAQHSVKARETIEGLTYQLERKNADLIQAQAEVQVATLVEHDRIESFQIRDDHLENVVEKYSILEKELDTYKEMLEESYNNIDSIKEQASKTESSIRDDLKRALDDLGRANCAVTEKTTELSKMKFELQQKNLAINRMEEDKFDYEAALNTYRGDIMVIRNRLDVAVADKMIAEKELKQVREDFLKLKIEKDQIIEELQQNVCALEEDNLRKEFEMLILFAQQVEKLSEKENLFELAKGMNMRLRETQKALSMIEEKFILKKMTDLIDLEQERALFLCVVKDSEKFIDSLQHHFLLLEEDFCCFLYATSCQLEEKQVQIQKLSDDLELITRSFVLKEQECHLKTILFAEQEEEITTLQSNLNAEELASLELRNYIKQLRDNLSMQGVEYEKQCAKLLNKLQQSEIEKGNLADQLGKLKNNIEILHDANGKLSLEKNELIQQMSEVNEMLVMICHADERLTRNWESIMMKATYENTVKESDKKHLLNSGLMEDNIPIALVKKNEPQEPGKRSPLKEQNH